MREHQQRERRSQFLDVYTDTYIKRKWRMEMRTGTDRQSKSALLCRG